MTSELEPNFKFYLGDKLKCQVNLSQVCIKIKCQHARMTLVTATPCLKVEKN